MPYDEGFATTGDGVRLYFQKLGSGAATTIVPNGISLVDDFKHLAGDRTLIFYDMRNRGRSDSISDASKLEKASTMMWMIWMQSAAISQSIE